MSLFLTVIAGLFLFLRSPLPTNAVRDLLINEISGNLGCRVEIGELEFDGPAALIIRGLRIFDRQDEILLDSETVRIGCRLGNLLRGEFTVSAIRQVDLHNPKIFLRQRADKRWNLMDLKQTNTTAESRFDGVLKFTGAQLTAQLPEAQLLFEQGKGEVDFAPPLAVAFRTDWRHQGALLQSEGQIPTPNMEGCLIKLQAEALEPSHYQAFIPAEFKTQLWDGFLRHVSVTVRQEKGTWQYSGELMVDSLGLDVADYALRQVQGNLAFDQRYLYVKQLRGQVNGQPIAVQGRMSWDGGDPSARLTVTGDHFDPAALNANWPINGPISFRAQLAYADRKILLQDGLVRMLNGEVHGTGWLNLQDNHYQIRLVGKQLAWAAAAPSSVALNGRADFELTAAGRLADWQNSDAVLSLRMGPGGIANIPYQQLTVMAHRQAGLTTIEYGVLQLAQGAVTASGTLAAERLRLQLQGQGVALRALTPLLGNEQFILDGNTNFTGQVQGTLSAPETEIQFNVQEARIRDQKLGHAQGRLRITQNQLVVQDVVVEDQQAHHQISGTIGLDSAKTMNVKVNSQKARAELFMQLLAPDQPLTGYVDNELEITGPLANATLKGKVRLTAGSYSGHLIEEIRGTYRREQGRTLLRDFVMQTMNARVLFGGEIAADNSLNFTVVARNFAIDRFPAQLHLPFTLAGRADFSGTVAGTINNPTIIGDLAAGRIFLNGQEISALQAKFALQNNQLNISRFDFAEGAGTYAFSGGGDIATGAMYGKLKIINGPLLGLMGIAKIPERRIQGQINGELVLDGFVQNPAVHFTGQITGAKIRSYSLNTVDFDLELRDRLVSIREFIARQPGDGVVAAKGTAALDGKIDMEVGGRNIDASLFNAVVDSALEAKGKIAFTAQASGQTNNPNIATSLEINQGSLGSASFDNLFGLFVLSDNKINVNQLYISKGIYKASAYGIIPLRALNPQGRKQADPSDTMNLKLLLDQANLSILPLLTDEVEWAVGPTTGEVNITGTLQQPYFDGKFTVDNGTVKLRALPDPVEKVAVDVRFEGDRITIRSCAGKLGGGTYTLTGPLQMDGLAFSRYDLKLVANKLGIRHKYLAGPVDGVLTLTGSGAKPVLGGKISIENTVIDIPGIPDSPDVNLDLGLDLEVVIGKKVRFYNPYLYDFVAEGRIKLTGTTQAPLAAGKVEVNRGNLRYLTNRFNIINGSLEFAKYDFIKPIIRLSAETRVGQTIVTLSANGPVDLLDVKLTSTPALTQQEIMMLLTTRGSGLAGMGLDFGRDQMMGLVNTGLHVRLISQVENSIRDMLGVDEVRLTRNSSSLFDSQLRSNTLKSGDLVDTGYRIEIIKYFSDKMSVMYTRGLDQGYNIVDFRYELNKHLTVGGTFISNGGEAFSGSSRSMFTIESRHRF